MSCIWLLFSILYSASFCMNLYANPFLLSSSDYEELQKEMSAKDLSLFVYERYPKERKFLDPSLAKPEDFCRRIHKALSHTLIDKEQGLLPTVALMKIGKGGHRCIVSYATFNGPYASFLKELPQKLEDVGFDGYLFYRLGGFPNPTGKELRYAGVPYAFKIFCLVEAQSLGFDHVLWIDSAFVPLRDPSPLFVWLENEGSFTYFRKSYAKYILPKTRELLQQETGVDVLAVPYISAQVLGFTMTKSCVQDFIREYYRLVELGTPFLSCFPEEYVFSAIMGKHPEYWKDEPFSDLVVSEEKLKGRTLTSLKKRGVFFLQKAH